MSSVDGHLPLGRRDFLAGVAGVAAAAAGSVAAGSVAGCAASDDRRPVPGSGAGAGSTTPGSPITSQPSAPLPGSLRAGEVPPTDTIFGWIEEIVGHGIRRPGYDADVWAETFAADQFRAFGLEKVRLEPVQLTRWIPRSWSLSVTPEGGPERELDCFPLPYAAPVDGLEVDLVAFDGASPGEVAGKASLYEAAILRVPPTAPARTGSAPTDLTGRIYDPDDTFEAGTHVLPFTALLQQVTDPSLKAGAVAFIGALTDYPGDSFKYFVPYQGKPLPVPGAWIRGSDGAWLKAQLARGPVRVRFSVDAVIEPFESHNVVGELAGADDQVVMVGSHHDGPWASAVEDGSGISLVLAQASFWAAQPRDQRPHRMVFVLHGGHMCGGAGLHAYIEAHRSELASVVLEVHLEHAALDFADSGDSLVPTGQCVPRWFFTSRIAPLEKAVADALVSEDLRRSMILAPDALGERPPTDGAFYFDEGVPIVHFLTAPFYLFDEIDRLDKVDRDHLVALTRATIRIIESTRGVTAADMRAR